MKQMFWRYAPVAAAFAGLLVLTACDGLNAANDTDAEGLASEDLTALADGLAQDLALTGDDARDFRTRFARLDAADREPGWLWTLADELHETLPQGQLDRIYALADERGGLLPGFGVRSKARRGPGGAGVGGPGFRRHGGPGGTGGQGRFGDDDRPTPLLDELGLTDDQKAQIEEIRTGFREQLRALFEEHKAEGGDRADLREQVEALREEMQAAIADVLTDEQEAQLEALKEERQQAREERQEERAERREAKRQVMQDVLGLTDAQIAQIESEKEALKAAAEALREHVRNGEVERGDVREQLEALHAEAEAALAEILEAEQEEVVKIHNVLAARLLHAKMDGRRGGGPFRGQPGGQG